MVLGFQQEAQVVEGSSHLGQVDVGVFLCQAPSNGESFVKRVSGLAVAVLGTQQAAQVVEGLRDAGFSALFSCQLDAVLISRGGLSILLLVIGEFGEGKARFEALWRNLDRSPIDLFRPRELELEREELRTEQVALHNLFDVTLGLFLASTSGGEGALELGLVEDGERFIESAVEKEAQRLLVHLGAFGGPRAGEVFGGPFRGGEGCVPFVFQPGDLGGRGFSALFQLPELAQITRLDGFDSLQAVEAAAHLLTELRRAEEEGERPIFRLQGKYHLELDVIDDLVPFLADDEGDGVAGLPTGERQPEEAKAAGGGRIGAGSPDLDPRHGRTTELVLHHLAVEIDRFGVCGCEESQGKDQESTGSGFHDVAFRRGTTTSFEPGTTASRQGP